MKGIRRSLNKERIGAPTPTYSTVSTSSYPSVSQQRPAQTGRPTAAPAPPKRVIRAITAYSSDDTRQLSFNEGDFFHVVSDDGGPDWFDAANPMTGARGLVPASCFQVLGRNVRETAQAGMKKTATDVYNRGTESAAGGSGQQPVGQKGFVPNTGAFGQAHLNAASNPDQAGRARPSSAPKPQPLYGVVQYDFVAERTDELDAKRGEPIIVIAQSNHEWFVAKPIGRLGGPGLIPVAFVEIQDLTTGKPVENVEELIRSAVVPKVEEWKKMTADYKSASIPLGRFDFPEQPSTSKSAVFNPSDAGVGVQQPGPGYDGQSSAPGNMEASDYDENGRYSYSAERERYGLVTHASVESFHQEEGSFWFHLRAHFSSGASLVLYRLYSDFYEFQITLMDEFPVEAGRAASEGSSRPPERILPMMPGPTDYEDEVICAQRVRDLSVYLADLCTLPERIRSSPIMYDFFVLRAGDVEVEKPGQNGRAPSIDGQYGELVQYLDEMEGPRTAPDISKLSLNENGHAGASTTYRAQSPPGRASYSSGPPQNQGFARTSQQDDFSSPSSSSLPPQPQSAPPLGNANQNVPFVKIKIFHRNTDDLIAIRVPPTVSHASLLDKVRERLGNDVINLRYREEVGSGSGPTAPAGGQVVMAGGARLISIETDQDLDQWIRGGSRLVLYAD